MLKTRSRPLTSLVSCLLVVVSGWAVGANATTYYVDPGGNDQGQGTSTSPFQTIQRGVYLARSGDEVRIRPGTYVLPSTISFYDHNVSLVADAPGAILDGSNLPAGDVLISIYERNNILVDGLELRNGPDRGIGFGPTVGSTVRNCSIHHNASNGMFLWFAESSLVTGNEIYENGYNASADGITHGAYIARGCDAITFSYNNVHDNSQTGLHVNGQFGEYIANMVIDGNVFSGNGGKGIDFQNTNDSRFVNNLLYDNIQSVAGAGVMTIDSPTNGTEGSHRNLIANNTFISPNNSRAIWLTAGESFDNIIFNNIVITTNASSAIDDDGVNNQIANNYAATYSNSVLNALFVDPSAGDYRLNEGSAADGTALTVYSGANAPATDITGNNRVLPYDMGAYELTGAPQGFLLNVQINGNGSVARSPNRVVYSDGETVTLTATGSGNYSFSNWGGDLSGSANPTTITMNSDHTVTAVFVAPDDPPAAPQGFTVSEINAQSVVASWDANSESDLAGYRLYIGDDTGAWIDSVNVGLNTSHGIAGLLGRRYFSVRAYDAAGQYSPYASEQSLYVIGSTPDSDFRIAYWTCDEGAGATASDAWGGFDGTLANGTAWAVTGAVSGALQFDGTDDRIDPGAVDIGDGPGLSIAFWCRADDFEIPDARLVSKATGTAEQDHYWMVSTVNQTGLRFRLRTDGQTTTLQTATGQLTAGRWYHIAAVYDGTTMRIYKDGAEVAAGAKTGIVDVDGGVEAAIGNQPAGAGNLPFDGMIDDVRLYRRPLSSDDIGALLAMRTNAAPVASFNASATTGTAPLDVSFDASASSDPDGDPVTYSWDFGDGATGTGVTTSHNYTLAGNYTAELTVRDNHGNSDIDQLTINVGEQTTPPAIPTLQIAVEDDPGCVTVTWLANGEPDLAGYTLYYGTQSVEGGEAASYEDNVVLGAVTTWRDCSFARGRYYFALRARNDSGQLSGFSSEMSLDVAGPDVVGPTVIPLEPSAGASGVALTSTVRFVVLDDRSGVDTGSMVIRINNQTPADVQLQPEPSGYTVSCTPAAAFPANSEVTVQVTVRDTATQPNQGGRNWSFTTVSVPPAVPTGLAATGRSDGSLHLTWDLNSEPDIAGYRIYYGASPRSYSDSITVGVVTDSLNIGGLADGTYYVALKARNAAGQMSGLSAEASATVTNPVAQGPTPPQGVQVQEIAPGCMEVSWNDSNDPQVAGYTLYYGPLSVAQGQTSIYFNYVDVKRNTQRQICELPTNTYYVAVRAYTSDQSMSGFSTEKDVDVTAPDRVAPTVELAYPSSGAVDVPQNVRAFFVLSDDQAGIDTSSVSIRIGNMSPESVEYTGDGNRFGAVCDLGQLLPSGSVVSVDVTVSDLASPANTATRSWSFTTGSAADLSPPTFLSYSPADGATEVDPNAEIVIQVSDETAIDAPRTQLFVNGGEEDAALEDAGGGRFNVRRQTSAPLPAGDVHVRVVAYDTADNRAELLFDFQVADFGTELASGEEPGSIVPDGFWADEPNRPLEIRNLPVGWTVRIFTTSGLQVRSFENNDEEGLTWEWDFRNDHGQQVAKALYLVRVIDGNGNVQQSGKFVVRLAR